MVIAHKPTGSFAARRLLVEGHLRGPGTVVVRDGRIAAVLDEAPGADGTLTPGLVDIHSNGAFGVDFADADVLAYRRALGAMARRGTTSVQPTSITAPIPTLLACLDRCRAAQEALAQALAGEPVARILGAHLEGPFLSAARRGAHRADWLSDPTPDCLDPLLAHPALTMMTLAPERDGALDAIRRLVAHGLGRRENGTISGAGTLLDEDVRRMIAAGLDPALVLDAATGVPARALGRHDIGRLASGARADLVLWDEDWHPRRVWVGGVEVDVG